MTKTVEVGELATRLDEVVSLAEAGTEVLVLEGQTPKAKLVAIQRNGLTEAELAERQAAVARITATRKELLEKYGEMPDSVELLREDRER